MFIPPGERRSGGVYRHHSVSSSVCLSVQIHVRPITSVYFDFGTWVYHHERMCRVYSWSQCDVGLWPKGQIYRVFDMPLCLGHSFSVLLSSHIRYMSVSLKDDMSQTWPLYDLDLWPQYINYIFSTWIFVLARSSLLRFRKDSRQFFSLIVHVL